jgi:protein-S-isoprenylcysteine O-methyltransferase Ste14
MIGEVSLYGIYFPPLLLLALLAFVVSRLCSRVLARTGFYRHVWHPALFDFSLYVIVLGSLVFIGSHWL